jgi:NAD-dependent deacetylase
MTVFSSQTQAKIEYAADLLRNAKHAVALTGAGISTPSGIPDFRSEGTGLWSRDEPMEVASLSNFRTDPERFFVWFRPLTGLIHNAVPNPAHIALAELEKAGRIQSVITQNIDTLHHKAGSKNVIEMHGTLRSLSCTQCFHKAQAEAYLPAFIDQGTLPYCLECSGLMKPDVILFGEQLPQQAWHEAHRESHGCDLMLVAGSSLEVLPVAGLPMQAIDRGAHLIILNNLPTYIDVRADVVIPEDVADIIPAIAEKTLHG